MFHLIDSEDALQARLASLPTPRVLHFDCEFVRERTFWPQLALVQIRVDDSILLVDPLPLSATGALPALLAAATTTVMHSPSEDLECLLHRFDCLPTRLFDTQLAASYCGLGPGLSYRALVERYTGVLLDKAETRSNWLARPLSDSQMRYAAEDVVHLPVIHAALSDSLAGNGRLAWFEEDCAAQLTKARDTSRADGTIVLDHRQTQRLNAISVARLQCILTWREHEARRADRPRSWLLDNETAYRLAAAGPGDASAHRRVFASAGRHSRKAPDALWEALQECVAAPPPDAAPLDEPVRRRRVAAVQDEVARCAAELDLPAPLLFPRRMVEALVDENGWPAGLSGWRESLLRERLSAQLGK